MAHTLLLAEPSLTIQRLVQLTFAGEDIDVVVATDGAEAMALAERLRPDVVLADVSLGLHSGYEVATFIRNHPQLTHVRVVLLSGAFERVDHDRALESGCGLVLAKPFDPLQLLTQVKRLIGAPPSERQGDLRDPGAPLAVVAPLPVQAPAPVAPALVIREGVPGESGHEAARSEAGFLAPGFMRTVALGHAGNAPPAKSPPAAPPADPYVFRRFAPEPGNDAEGARAGQSRAPVETADVLVPEAVRAVPVRDRLAPVAEEPTPPHTPPSVWVPPPGRQVAPAPLPSADRVPSFEMLALTNKGMHLVQPPEEFEDEAGAPTDSASDVAALGEHDLGNLIPALDDYFDQLDAAFATNVDQGFRRAPDLPPPVTVAPTAPAMPSPQAREMEPPAAPVHADSTEDRGPLASPVFSLRPDASRSENAHAGGGSASIDDAYEALMRQLSDPKRRAPVVALRANDELLVERAVERVLERLDPAAVREAMEDVITNQAKRIIQEEIERIRRP